MMKKSEIIDKKILHTEMGKNLDIIPNVRIGIVNFPSESNFTPLSNLIMILNRISDNISVILGKNEYLSQKGKYPKIHFFPLDTSMSFGPVSRMINYGIIQITISFKIFIIGNKVNSWIFFIGGDTLVLPMFLTRFLRKKVFILIAGSSIKTLESKNDPLCYGLKLLRFITCTLANKIIVYADCLIGEYSLERWTNKIITTHRHVIDFDIFKIKKDFILRDCIIGYMGRFSEEKGIWNFVETLSGLINNYQDLTVIIGGDGPLKNDIEKYLIRENLTRRVNLVGWISHDNLPDYLNQMRLLVLPSYTEGLPNIMLESMACGTPVLATPVGVVPDIIKDGKTGFIMENSSPVCIAENVNRALNYPELDRIAINGRRFIEDNFVFEKTINKWKKIFNGLC